MLLKTKRTSDNNLSQQKVEEHDQETTFIIEPDLEPEQVKVNPSTTINLQYTRLILLHLD